MTGPNIPTADPMDVAKRAADDRYAPPTGHVTRRWRNQDDIQPGDKEAAVGRLFLMSGSRLALAALPTGEDLLMHSGKSGTWQALSSRSSSGGWTALTTFGSLWQETARGVAFNLRRLAPKLKATWGMSAEESEWWAGLLDDNRKAIKAAGDAGETPPAPLPDQPDPMLLIERCADQIEEQGLKDAARQGDWAAQVHRRLAVVVASHRQREVPVPGGPVECRIADFDADPQYMGHPGGVLKLRAGGAPVTLTGAPARRALVTSRLPDLYDPDARHDDVDRLLAFPGVDPVLRDYFLDELAYSMLGVPSRRILALKGPKKGGKSALASTLQEAFGPYVGTASRGAFNEPDDDGPTPGLKTLMAPVRLAFYPEGTKFSGSTQRLNAVSGGDTLVYRGLYEAERSGIPTATVCFVSNTPPDLGAGGTDEAAEALRSRLKVIECPSIPAELQVEGFAQRWIGPDGRERRQALVAAILGRLTRLADGAPTAPDIVHEATRRVADETASEIVKAVRELIVEDPDGWLYTADLAVAVNEHLEKSEKHSYGVRTVSRETADLLKQKTDSHAPGGRRAFKGWRLIRPVRTSGLQARQPVVSAPPADDDWALAA